MWFSRRVRGLEQGTDLRGHRGGKSDEPLRHVALLQNNRALTRRAPVASTAPNMDTRSPLQGGCGDFQPRTLEWLAPEFRDARCMSPGEAKRRAEETYAQDPRKARRRASSYRAHVRTLRSDGDAKQAP